MCRLAAYAGPPIALEQIVIDPPHSLVEQSQSATEAKLAVNGDGFGIAWYGDDEKPGQYRDILPAWSNSNLPSICRMIKSPLFLSHVRASTTGGTSWANCHPFVHQKWAFMHNGQVGNFSTVRRILEARLPDDLYEIRRGTTDSELLFLLLLDNGLDKDPKLACERVIGMLEAHNTEVDQPNRLTCVFSNGEKLHAFRHSCDSKSPTLYLSKNHPSGGRALASEPLDGKPENWIAIGESEFVTLSGNGVSREPLDLASELKGAA